MTSAGTRGHISHILQDVVRQLDPRRLVSDAVSLVDDRTIRIAGIDDPVRCSGNVLIVAVGKASVPMAAGALESLGDRAGSAIAVTKAGIPLSVEPPHSLEILEADHPVPEQTSLIAGKRVRELVEGCSDEDLVVMLISGGGSALIEDLVDGVTLDDLRAGTDHLLRAGATINELNAVRRRISRLKGGRLARAAAPARVANLIVSDVLNSPLQDIASGPTVRPPDQDEIFDAVMKRPELVEGLPDSIRQQLDAQRKPEEPWPESVLGTTILADAESAARAAAATASQRGFQVQTLGFDFQGEARELGRTWGTIARHAVRVPRAFSSPLALIGSGEATVTVRGDGTGGRNTEMALSAALEIDELDNVAICSFATDGDDGLSQFAGGVVDGTTRDALRRAGIDAVDSLANNNSAPALRAVDAAIDIGPTGTNVNDIYIALVGNPDGS